VTYEIAHLQLMILVSNAMDMFVIMRYMCGVLQTSYNFTLTSKI